jgi:hypothetical protein
MDRITEIEKEIKPGLTCPDAIRIIKSIADILTRGEVDPKRGANDIYWTASHADAWHHDDSCSDKIAEWGSELLQLADALEEYRKNPRSIELVLQLIREAASAITAEGPLPEWRGTSAGVERGPAYDELPE